MHPEADLPDWRFCRFGLLVTGRGEAEFIPDLFRCLAATGRCSFTILRRIGQRSPMTSPKRELRVVGTRKQIPDRDADEIDLPARGHLIQKDSFVVVLDGLEHNRRPQAREIFERYRGALDAMLESRGLGHRASVHFLVNMLEAYYLANAAAVNSVLGTSLSDFDGDVEDIRHPKNDLKKLGRGFDEYCHGAQIVARLDVPHVLSRVGTCASLRTLFAWCARAAGVLPTTDCQLDHGAQSIVTGPQMGSLRTEPHR